MMRVIFIINVLSAAVFYSYQRHNTPKQKRVRGEQTVAR